MKSSRPDRRRRAGRHDARPHAGVVGVRCLLVERNAATTRHPKMDITNGRSMELFRRLGLVDQLRAVAVAEENNFDVSWITVA